MVSKTKKYIAVLLAIVMVITLFPGVAMGIGFPQEGLEQMDSANRPTVGTVELRNLMVNYQVNPVGIDRDNIRFSWQLVAASDVYAVVQTGATLTVTNAVTGVTIGTQTVTGNQNQGVLWNGSVPALETRFNWQVTVNYTVGGTPAGAPITAAGSFVTGADWSDTEWVMPAKSSISGIPVDGQPDLRDAGNTWLAPNVGAARTWLLENWGYAPSNAVGEFAGAIHGDYVRLGGNPLMRMEGALPAGLAVESAILYMTALGDYIPFINGERVAMADPMGNDIFSMFAPGFTDFNMFINYQTYDVTNMLEDGQPFVLGALVNKGAYAGRVGANYYGSLGRHANRLGPDPSRVQESGIPGIAHNSDPGTDGVGRPGRGTGNPDGPLISPLTRYVPFTDNPSRTLGLRAQLVVTFDDGSVQQFGRLAGEWVTIAGPAVFNDYFNGEFTCGVRAALLDGWSTVGFTMPTEINNGAWFPAVGASTVNPTWVDANGNITAAAPLGRLCGMIQAEDLDTLFDTAAGAGRGWNNRQSAVVQATGQNTPLVPALTWISYPMEQLRPNNTAVARFHYDFTNTAINGFFFDVNPRSVGTIRTIPALSSVAGGFGGTATGDSVDVLGRQLPFGAIVPTTFLTPVQLTALGASHNNNQNAELNIGSTDAEAAGASITLRAGERLIVEMGMYGTEYDARYNRGQNMVGVLELELTDTAGGTPIGVRHAELLNDGWSNVAPTAAMQVSGDWTRTAAGTLYYDALRGDQNQASFYVTREGRQTWRPLTQYSGFQFVEIFIDDVNPASTAEVTLHGIRGRVITSAHNRVSYFTVDGTETVATRPGYLGNLPNNLPGAPTTTTPTYASLVTQLYDNMIWGMMGNWITIPIDCPQRPERVGWAGDAQIFAQTAISTFDTIGFYENYMQIMNANADRFGNFGQVMPGGWSGNNQNMGTHSGWSDAGIVIPWTMFLNTGDTYLIESGWEQMNHYLDVVWGNGVATPNVIGGEEFWPVLREYPSAANDNNGVWEIWNGTAYVPWESPNGRSMWYATVVGGTAVHRNLERINNFNSDQFYGDWLGMGAAHLLFMNAVYQIYHYVMMIEMGEAIGADAARLQVLRDRHAALVANFLRPAVIEEVPPFWGTFGQRGNNPLGRVRLGGGFLYSAEDAERFGMQEGDLMTFGPVRNNFIVQLGDNAQTGLIWALRLGLYTDEDHRQHLVNRLDEHVRNEGSAITPTQHENTLTTGFLGVNKLLPFMTDAGLADTALDMFLSYDMASWLFSVRQGATTMWERWNSFAFPIEEHNQAGPDMGGVRFAGGFGPTNMNSFNHFAYGASAEWMYEYLAGIQVSKDASDSDVGFRHFTLQPTIDKMGRLTEVFLEQETQIGRIISTWQAEDGFLTRYEAHVPANTTATLFLPAVITEAQFEGMAAYATGAATWVGLAVHNGQTVTEIHLQSGDFLFDDIPNQAALFNTVTFENVGDVSRGILARATINGGPEITVPRILRVPVGEAIEITITPVDTQYYAFVTWGGDATGNLTIPTLTFTPTTDRDITFTLEALYEIRTLTVTRGVANSEVAPLPSVTIAHDGVNHTVGDNALVITERVMNDAPTAPVIELDTDVANFVDYSFANWTRGETVLSTESALALTLTESMEIIANFNWNDWDSRASIVNNENVTVAVTGQANAGQWAGENLVRGNITNLTTPDIGGWSSVALQANTVTDPVNPDFGLIAEEARPWAALDLGEVEPINRFAIYPRACASAADGAPANFPAQFRLEFATGELDFPTGVANAELQGSINALNWQSVVGAHIALDGTPIEAVDGVFTVAPEDIPRGRPLVIELPETINARYVRLTGIRIHGPEAGTTAFHVQLVHFGVYNFVPSNDASLSNLTVQGHTLTPAFNPEYLAYTVNVPNATTTVVINYETTCAHATVEIDGPATLAVGNNVFTVTVTAEDGTVRVYMVTVIRAAQGPTYHTVRFELNGGTRTGGGELTQTIRAGQAALAPTVTPPVGYRFVRWDTAFNNVQSNLVVTAIWERIPVGPEYEMHPAYVIGNAQGYFQPGENATRAHVATILARVKLLDFEHGIEELPEGMEVFDAFSDVNEGDWFYYYIAWAYDAGLVEGFNGHFRPDDYITREELAAIMVRTLDEYEETAGEIPFDDADLISDWALHYVYTAFNEGLVIGDGSGNFNPLGYSIRAYVATIANRILGRIDSWDALDAAEVVNRQHAFRFPDVAATAWYYPSILAAANDHRLTRDDDDAIDWKYIIRQTTP